LQPPALLLREWATIALVIGLILACGATSWALRRGAKAHLDGWDQLMAEAPRKIEIAISGAVLRPGTYLFSPGVTVRQIFQEVALDKKADRKKLNFKKVIYTSEAIDVPFKAKKSKRNS
jgi:hypothetical protein